MPIMDDPFLTVIVTATTVAVVFAVLLVLVALVSPLVNNRSLVLANRESRNVHLQRIQDLEDRLTRVEQQNAELIAKNLELSMRNNELAHTLKQARDNIVKLQEQVWELRGNEYPDR